MVTVPGVSEMLLAMVVTAASDRTRNGSFTTAGSIVIDGDRTIQATTTFATSSCFEKATRYNTAAGTARRLRAVA